ncbi:type IV toxin-antitoxin system AbiEi family antitoxin domain-containing protein [[Mycobacterium] burgundiense]|uniref:DUF559 domain-containing protein n=1 Tax=[Mycobacterium] burgundiense TaxID=3064286 RepID=A0ABM9M480_9MYCO|nr:type IV toxin-antitoxin system AbiEi family antitoxin domain-containing protein [Mycolicibacterium sp. MU0053]CAJ1509950.1 DUF559 domain-containing protein [Mycolicibacterium sp. MU0053]
MEDHLLRSHDGVITLAQAREAGLSKDAVRRRVQSGRWRRVARGVYFADDRPFTAAARIRAAVWGHGADAVASGAAAAWWHDLSTSVPDVVDVTLPRTAHSRKHPGTRIRRRDLCAKDIVERRGLRVTSLPLTAVENSARVLDRALQGQAELEQLWRTHVRNKGRYGAPRARINLLAADDGSRSKAERIVVRLLQNAAITGWAANFPVGPFFVDFAFPEPKVAIEIDGFAFHSGVEEFVADRSRQNFLVLRGWQVLRFTWWDLIERPERVIAEIRRAISVR